MEFDNFDLIEVACVQKTHGLKGHLNIGISENFSNDILKENMPVFLEIEGIPVPFFIEELKHSGNNVIVKLKNINSADYAARFKSCPVHIIPEDIVEEQEFEPDFDLYDYEVYDELHGYVGKIKIINFIPGNPVFETDLDGKRIILPYSDEFIKNISHDKRRIDIISPDGLIDIYLQ